MGNTPSGLRHHGAGGAGGSASGEGNAGSGQASSAARGSTGPHASSSGASQGIPGSNSRSRRDGGEGGGVPGGSGLRADRAAVKEAPPKDDGNKALAATLFPQDARVDNGHLLPLSNVYPTSPQDWLHDSVQRLIVDRKLAPFYRGLEDWDEDDYDKDEVNTTLDTVGDEQSKNWRRTLYTDRDRLAEAAMYKRTAECPICFLYYPPLINTSRCCDQPICTECFVQIKRADATTTNMISEPAACPYCVESNFGVTYVPPPVSRRTGLGAPQSSPSRKGKTSGAPALERSSSSSSTVSETDMGPAAKAHARRKSVSHTSADVVTVDAIQADWEAKLAAVQATAARRAARRVVFRQVGDRLVPVGISSGREITTQNSIVDDHGRLILTGPVSVVGQGSGSVGATSESGSAHPSGTSRLLSRGVRRHRDSHGEQDQRIMGTDIEELMVMEAMRLSMLDEEERRKKAEKEAKAKEKKEGKASSWLKRSTGVGSSSAHQADVAGASSSSSRGASLDLPRPSTESATRAEAAPVSAGPSSSSAAAAMPAARAPPASAASRYGGSNKSSFLKMPPMQRNDSSASMANHNLPPPLVPTRAGPAELTSEGPYTDARQSFSNDDANSSSLL